MKRFLSSIIVLLFCSNMHAQQLSQVTFSGGATLTSLAFVVDGEVLIRISEEGKIMEWGIEVQSLRYNNYYAPKLQPYLGRVDYYGPEADSVNRGKVRSIGTATVTYYGPYETAEKIGKLKSVGTIALDYYTNYENTSLKGKLKFIGNLLLNYYSSFEDQAFKGKIKSIGSSTITYYSSFDDKAIRGKIKNIGGTPYTWYTSLDHIGYGGSLKSPIGRQNISGITYILQ